MKSIDLIINYIEKNNYSVEKFQLGHPKSDKFIKIASKHSSGSLMLSGRRISFPFASSSARDITGDKTKTYDYAKILGVRTPHTLTVDASKDMKINDIQAMLKNGSPLVVKPHNGLQSRGLSMNLKTANEVINAIRKSIDFSQYVLVQEQISGEEYRFISIDGKIESILMRERPKILGNGKDTVRKLLDVENSSRSNISNSLVHYPRLNRDFIDSHIMDILDSTPDKGEKIILNQSTMIRGGASVYETVETMHQSYIDIAKRMTAPLGARVSCADLIIKDRSLAANKNNYSLIEMNLGMSLPMCYSCRDGKHFNIIEKYIGPMLIKILKNHNVLP